MPGFPHSFPFIFGLITGTENPQEFPLTFPFAFGLVKGSADVAVEAALSADMSVIHYSVAGLDAQADVWSEVVAAFAGYSENAISVVASAEIGDGLDTGLAVSAGLPADASGQFAIEADLSITAHGDVSGGYGVRGTPTVEVLATADTRLDAFAGSSLAGSVDTSGHVGDGIATDTVVTVGLTADVSVHRAIAATLTVGAETGQVPSHGLNLTGTLPVVAGITAQGNANRQFEANLGAITGLSAAGRRNVPAGSNTLNIGVTVTAGMSLGQAAQANLSSQVDTAGVERRGRFIGADFPILVTRWAEPYVQYAGTNAFADITATFTASMVVSTVIDSDLAVQVVLSARFELGGTTDDRIMVVAAEVRTQVVEPREGSYLIESDIRTMPVEARDAVFAVEPSDRQMLVETRV